MSLRSDPRPSTDVFPAVAARTGRVSALVEAAFWSMAVIGFLAAGWSWLDSHRFQRQALASLEADSGLPAHGATAAPPNGTPIGLLEIPRLGLRAAVAEGTDADVLQKAVGRMPKSARPGEPGNLALAGHRDTFFRPLADIRVGDRVIFRAASGEPEAYEVEWIRVVEPDETWVAAPTLDDVLTLVTCYPFRYVGSAPQRFVVRAARLASPPSPGG